MVSRCGHPHLALPLWLEQVFPALRRILCGDRTAVVGGHDVLMDKGDRAAVVIDQIFAYGQGFIVKRFVKLAEPKARMVGIGGDHEIPFGRSARDRLSYNLAHVPGHRSGGNKLYIDIGSVFFIECLSYGLGALSLPRWR